MALTLEELKAIPVKDLARLCGVSERTARRWVDRTRCPPPAALILLEILLKRDLGALHPAWSDWVISHRGELCSPENWIATPGDIRAMQLKEAQVSALRTDVFVLRARIAELERTVPWLEDQPLPAQWEFKAG